MHGINIYRVAACDLCVELVKAANHDVRETWVLTAYGATHMMNRIEALEGAMASTRENVAHHEQWIGGLEAMLPDDSEDGKDCDGELQDEKVVVSVDGLSTRPVPVRVPGEPGWFVRLEFYNYLAELWNRWCDKREKDEHEKTGRDKLIEAGLEEADEKIDGLRSDYRKLRKEVESVMSELDAAHRKLHN